MTEPTGPVRCHPRVPRLLATALAREGTPIAHAPVAPIWHRFVMQPRREQTLALSTDPALEAKIRDVVGLYLLPPA